MLTLRGLPSDSTCVLIAGPGELDIKTHEPGILFISLPIVSLFKRAIMTLFFYFCVDSALLATSFNKCNDIMTDKGTCHGIDNVNQATCNDAVNMRGN